LVAVAAVGKMLQLVADGLQFFNVAVEFRDARIV
jgi:hypothetical protein